MTDNQDALAGAIDTGDVQAVRSALERTTADHDLARSIDRLTTDQAGELLHSVGAREAAELLEQLPESVASAALTGVSADDAADILENLESDDRADLLARMTADRSAAVLDAMDPGPRDEARRLLAYGEQVAGGLMVTEYITLPETISVAEALEQLERNRERYADYDIDHVYLVDSTGCLTGWIGLRDLFFADRNSRLTALHRVERPVTVLADAPLEEIEQVFRENDAETLPVCDAEGRLVGVLRKAAVEQALVERTEDELRKARGIVSGEELRSMPWSLRSRRRLTWLFANIGLNAVGVIVIASFESTIAQVTALAVFLPVISDMSGNAGNQSLAVTMRELSLGLLREQDVGRVVRKEIGIGLLNGLLIGLVIAIGAMLYKGNPYLGLVIGLALWANTVLGAIAGGVVPLMLKRLRFDPALASGPLLTTITDLAGFLMTLGLASAMLPWLKA